MKLHILLLLIVIFCISLFGGDENPDEIFVEANRRFSSGDYTTSLSLYNSLISKGYKNGTIYYNIGNCNYRLNKIGAAILNYRRALIYTPRDSDLKANLEEARGMTRDYVEELQTESLAKKLLFFHNIVNKRESFFILLIVNFLFFGVLSIRLFRNIELLNYILIFLFLLLTTFGYSFSIKQFARGSFGVVLSDIIEVKSGLSSDSTTLFALHEGCEFKIIEFDDGWLKIVLADKKRGWVKRDGIGLIED